MLKYRFICIFTDGSVIEQNKEDVSKIDPKRSSFYDVLQSKKEIKEFILTRGIKEYKVNLLDGHFEVNGNKFWLESKKLPTYLVKRELIFYRQHNVEATANFKLSKNKIWNILGVDKGNDRIFYYLGWQTTIKGKNYQEKIYIE